MTGGEGRWFNKIRRERERERGNTEEMARVVKVEIIDRFGVAFEGSLEFASLPIPNLDGGVFTGGGQDGILWMEGDLGNGGTVAGEGMCGWISGKPVGVIGTFCGCGG